MVDHIFTYDISSNEAFDSLAHTFSGALRAVAPLGSVPVLYNGQNLYHPFQIAVNGRPGSGKSTFIRTAVEGFLGEPVERIGRSVSSADETRTVQIWFRWITPKFEVRSEDHLAQQSLAGTQRHVFPPELKGPAIAFYEHAFSDMRDACPVAIQIFYDDDGHRFLRVKANDNVVQMPGFEQDFLAPARSLQIS